MMTYHEYSNEIFSSFNFQQLNTLKIIFRQGLKCMHVSVSYSSCVILKIRIFEHHNIESKQ